MWENQKINCGIFAFFYANTPAKNRNRSIKTIRRHSLWFQTKYGFGETMAIREYEKILALPEYNHLRVVVMQSNIPDCHDTTCTGAKFGVDVPEGWHPKNDTIWIVYDFIQKHFGAVQSSASIKNHYDGFCHDCLVFHWRITAGSAGTPCKCNDAAKLQEREERRLKRNANKNCVCGASIFGKYKTCKNCKPCNCGAKGVHRCISRKTFNEKKVEFLKQGEVFDEKNPKYDLVAWDCESGQELVIENEHVLQRKGVAMTETGYEDVQFDENEEPVRVYVDRTYHNVNLICMETSSGLKKRFADTDEDADEGSVLYRFVRFLLNHNNGYNRCYAHNSSGYDSRLLFEALSKVSSRMPTIAPIARGSKFIVVNILNLHFCDSMLLLPGSLAGLAKSFVPDNKPVHYFPFGMLEDVDYDGEFPSKEMFYQQDYSPGEKSRFNSWYEKQIGKRWCYKKELEIHCGDDGSTLRKGHFPHLFNRKVNYDYEGVIPPIRDFALQSNIRSESQLWEFKFWHKYQTLKTMETPWNFKTELYSYCENDVTVLMEIMKKFHEIAVKDYGMSPFHYATLPSFTSTAQRVHYSQNIPELQELEEEGLDQEEKNIRVEKLATKTYWGVQKDVEYTFTRKSLFGGRTDLRHIYWNENMNPDGEVDGLKYAAKSVDVVSLYPYCQLAFEYPVGLPTIEIYDKRHTPCLRHEREDCECLVENQRLIDFTYKQYNLVFKDTSPTANEILADDSFFGFAKVTMEPPADLFHPILPRRGDGKCVFSNEEITGIFGTPEIKAALHSGYTLVELYRLDRYNKGPGLWNEFLATGIMNKIKNSSSKPNVAELAAMANSYEKQFPNQGWFDRIMNSGDWGKNAAARHVYKIIINCLWGKECQNPERDEIHLFNEDGEEDCKDFLKSAENGDVELKSYSCFPNHSLMRARRNNRKVKPLLKDFYLPAGVMVPMYGRLVLWEMLNKLSF